MPNPKNIEGHKFPPGKSGNPKGRPKHPKNFAEFREAAKEFLNEPSTANKTRLEAAMAKLAKTDRGIKTLLEYAFGKVPLQITGQGEGPVQVKFVDDTKPGKSS